jgi:hypothetical protein
MQRVRHRAAGSSPTRCGPHHQAQRPRRVRSQRVAPCCSRFQPACLPASQSASLPARARSEHGRSCQPDQQQRPYKCARAVNASRRAADPAALSASLPQPCSLARQPARARARHARTSRSSDPERGSVTAASWPYYSLRYLQPSVARLRPLQQASPAGLPGARVRHAVCRLIAPRTLSRLASASWTNMPVSTSPGRPPESAAMNAITSAPSWSCATTACLTCTC